ncbi:SAM-dependent methyltransferase, UbiE family [Treponema primitia ZAS-2]|uniref:SAM-dependent methyltransferase, UbiE family n=2 Tax=Treponema primitia TaxID=88058 RepID=F5YJ36_TREPZ|nr:SAM-dependent methyltransferase, UbiE family [Treponema primitia ZAS-2]
MLKDFFQNTRNPKGIGGAIMLWSMNWGHSIMAKWGLKYLNIKNNDIILDIGCGGGANILRMLKKASDLKIFSIDYSELSVKKAIKYNKKAINKNICEIKIGNVSNIPYNETTFDIVTAFETTYFWPDIINDLKEKLRVLKSGGTFFICNEAVSVDNEKTPYEYFIKILDLNIYSPNDFVNILTKSGFIDININLSKNKKLVCVIAKKA